VKPKNYVLIIDEINRGNVSQIFGELITLIEDDKREGCAEALEVMLPYSKKSFSVPPNLYIIGTMNTADRSVEALDTALRRRFSFIEMLPQEDNPDIRDIKDINLKDVLKSINRRLETLLSRDHMIGHSFFLNINIMLSTTKLSLNYKNTFLETTAKLDWFWVKALSPRLPMFPNLQILNTMTKIFYWKKKFTGSTTL
jgi:5-methylcytosine-specific restriction endonuclease McrBC GTP-binding regulatory subunit McrB